MAEALVLRKNDYPTYLNKEALIGTLIAFPIGTAIGAYIGKKRMEEEQEHGKIVTDNPSFWNKDALIGGLLGMAMSGVAALLTGVAAVAATGGIGFGVVAAVGGALAATALGTYIGGKMGISRQTSEYEEAKKQTIVNHLSQTVSPEVGKAVEYSMAHNKEWGKQVAEDRLLADAQAHRHA